MNKKMKSRILFTSTVLPMLFAACTAEDLVNDQNVGTSLEGRALLAPITITVNGDTPDTRFSWNEAGGAWNGFTAEDKFSAGLVDGATLWTPTDKVLTNYVYSTENGTSYTTTSQMVEGTYFFYSYPGFENSAARGTINFDLTSQDKIDLNNAAATVEQNQLFIAPLYKLEEKTANNNLGLTFISYWSTAAIKIANTSSQSFKIIRMALVDDADNFAVKGYVSPEKIDEANLCYEYDADKGEYVLPVVDGKQVEYDAIRTADIAKGAESGDQPLKVKELIVDCQAYELAAGKDVMAYMQVPAGQYDGLKLQLTIEVTEGKEILTKNVSKDLATNVTVSGLDKTQFSRGKTNLVFGREGDEPAAFEIDDIEIIAADPVEGLYASSYDDMYKYLSEAESGEALTINNYGSLKLDDLLMVLINRLNHQVTFSNAIEITSERTADVTKVKFANGATLAKGTVTFGESVEVPTGKTLTIAEGATAKITSAISGAYAGTIQNNGTLELAVNDITNINKVECGENATITISDDITWDNSRLDMPKTLNVSAQKSLTLDSNVIPYTTTVNNYGTIVSGVNEGVVNNNGTITAITIQNPNQNDAKGNQIIATINNYGKIEMVTFADGHSTSENALVVMMNENASISTASGDGDINNTVSGFITNPGNANVYAAYSGDQNGVLGNSSCKTIYVEDGKWTNASIPSSVTKVVADGVELSPATGKTIDFGSVTDLTLTGSTVQGNLTTGELTALKLDGTTFNGTLNLSTTSAALDLVGVTFNGAVSASNVATININGADKASATNPTKTTINATVTTGANTAITVDAKAVLEVTANGVIGGASGSINNNGIVNNRGKILASSAHSGNGTWNGAESAAQ